MNYSWSRLVLCVSLFATLFAGAANADELATLTGFVNDPSGLRIPHTKVQVTKLETNVSYNGETNEVGMYRVSGLPTGSYRVIVQKMGSKPS